MDKKELKEIATELFDVGAIKYGDFTTKVGLKTPVYIDLRVIIAYPDLLTKISKQLWALHDNEEKCDQICGVPYTALPIATLISVESKLPMLMRRKEAKDYGTKKMIEGIYKQGDVAVIIEDIITSGSSVLEVAGALNKEGLNVSEALIVVDREQGGRKNLERTGLKVKSLFRITEIMKILLETGRVDEKSVKIVTDYVKAVEAPIKVEKKERLIRDFRTRAKSAKNTIAAKVLNLMADKKTTVCLAADSMTASEILDLAEVAGPHIATLKIHVDEIEDFSQNFITSLKSIAKKHNFLIMEDRKFADIGNTVSNQFRRGVYHIAEWADCVTVHALPGNGVLDGIKNGLKGISGDKGVFVLAEMSSKGALTTADYAKSAVNMAKDDDLVAGVVCQNNIFDDLGLVQLTPGVKLTKSADNLGQQYNTPADVVKNGADLVVVGRGITEAKDKLAAILEYKKVLFEAYESRVH